MNQREFRQRLDRASDRANEVASQLVVETLPSSYLYLLPPHDDPRGRRGPIGTMKYFGGRFLTERDLHLITGSRAAELLWADGKVPMWINIHVEDVTGEATHMRLRCSSKLVRADEATSPRDIAPDATDPIEPFRVRGPAMPPGWRSVERDGRILLRRTEGAG